MIGEWGNDPPDAARAVPQKVRDAVAAEVEKQLHLAAAEGVASVLDEDLLDHVRSDAAAVAQAELDEALTTGAAETGGEDAAPELRFSTLPAFVEWLTTLYWRATSPNGLSWCPQWWRHPEAVYRLDALWRSFEHLRNDPATGASVWLRDHVDHHMAVLLDPDGPLRACDPDQGHRTGSELKRLAVEPPPSDAMFADLGEEQR